MKFLIVVAGPTAIGKTLLAIQLAQQFDTEIISADSRQFYKELDIGVAKPSYAELSVAKHHFIGHISIEQDYTVADFEKDALKVLDELFKTHRYVILAGGSGLFINAVLNGLNDLPSDEIIRETLNHKLETGGLIALTEQLKQLDEETYNTIDINNPRRVLRALEICLASGKKASELRSNQTTERNFTPIKIVLDMEREQLYQRINQRADAMMAGGLLAEAQALLPYRHLNALQTVGYKELFDYFDNKTTFAQAVDLIKQHTRNYAKRQLTWFRKDKEYQWFHPDEVQQIINYVVQYPGK